MSFGTNSSNQTSNSVSQQNSFGVGESFQGGSSSSSSNSDSSSRSSNPNELSAFFRRFNRDTGGYLDKVAGQAPLKYEKLDAESVKALGGLGATRLTKAKSAYQDAMDEISQDPSLTTAQKRRAAQISGEGFAENVDAIAKETDSALTAFLAGENQFGFNAGLESRASELASGKLLAEIFFGGKGQNSRSSSSSSSSGSNSGYSYNVNGSEGSSVSSGRGSSSGIKIGL